MKTLKKLITLLIAGALCFSFFACSSKDDGKSSGNSSYNVTFSANKPIGVSSNVTGLPQPISNIKWGETISEPPTKPSLSGYIFGGWFKESACTNKWTFSSDTVTRNRTLFAKWTDQNESGGDLPSNPTLPKNAAEWKTIITNTRVEFTKANPNYKITQTSKIGSNEANTVEFIVDNKSAFDSINYYSIEEDGQSFIYHRYENEYYKQFQDYTDNVFLATDSASLELFRNFHAGQDQVQEVFPYLLMFFLTENNFEWLQPQDDKLYLKDGHLDDIFKGKLSNFDDIKSPSTCSTGEYYCIIENNIISGFGFNKYNPSEKYEYTITYGGQHLTLPTENIIDSPRYDAPVNLRIENNELLWDNVVDSTNNYTIFVFQNDEYIKQALAYGDSDPSSLLALSTLELTRGETYQLYVVTNTLNAEKSQSYLSDPITYTAP